MRVNAGGIFVALCVDIYNRYHEASLLRTPRLIAPMEAFDYDLFVGPMLLLLCIACMSVSP